jgi:hypothetical protein
MPDAVTLIQQDHRMLAALLDRLRDPAARRVTLVEELFARTTAHLRAEEQVYPLLAGTDPAEYGSAHRGVPAGGEVEERLRILRATDPNSDDFDAAVARLATVFTHHVDAEEAEIMLHTPGKLDPGIMTTATATFDAHRRQELRVYGVESLTG